MLEPRVLLTEERDGGSHGGGCGDGGRGGGGDQTTAMLCSSGAKGNWRCKLTAGIKRQPCSAAVALRGSVLPRLAVIPANISMWPDFTS